MGLIESSTESGVRLLTFARAEKKNAFNVELARGLRAALSEAEADDAVRVVCVTGSGNVFSAGADVSLFLAQGTMPREEMELVGRLDEPLKRFPKPLIAIVNGPAVGMGVTLLPHFDLVYASTEATFLTPFMTLGLLQEFGSSFTLPRLIGHQRAKELVLRARPLDAATAADWGLVTRVFAPDALRTEALSIAREIAAHPPGAVAESLRLFDLGREASLERATESENAALRNRYGSAENVAAVERFLNRRK